jgi:UDP-N-acetylmuramoyl-L-alanyl-D-glutamate--2,6-diaminopimelate ligase
VKIAYEADGFDILTDDTQELQEGVLFLKTAQNARYFDALEQKPPYITPAELIEKWQLDTLKVVGVTGTNGKTTTTAAMYSILLDLGEKAALQGTRGLIVNEAKVEEKSMTTPSILQTLYNMKRAKDAGCGYFIMEVSSHAIHQNRIEAIDFALKVHTNVTRDHLDYHGTVEAYRRVKSAFFADEAMKLLNKDDIKNITYNPKNAFTYGVDEPATFKVQAFSLVDGITASVKYLFEEEGVFHSYMVGLFNLYNLTAAVASVKLLTKRTLQEICDVVEGFGGVAGRMEVVSFDPFIVVDFAHTDDGIYQVLKSIKDRDIAVVFGAGGDRDREKRPRMGAVAGRFAKKIYVTTDNPRSEEPEAIIDEILVWLKGKEGVKAIVDRREAIRTAIDELQEGEVLLVLGKGDETTMEIKGEKIPFDDRAVVREILREKEKGV